MGQPAASQKAEPKPWEVFTLHKYFIHANFMRHRFFEKAVAEGPAKELVSESKLFMDAWYVGLYVVIEGWKTLNLTDSTIDELLRSPNGELLRRYRNGICHFQRKYFDDRFMALIQEKSVVMWLQVLNREFGRFLLEYINTHDHADLIPPELRAEDSSQD